MAQAGRIPPNLLMSYTTISNVLRVSLVPGLGGIRLDAGLYMATVNETWEN